MSAECDICFRHCRLSDGQTGFCRARAEKNGKIVSVGYGQLTSVALDPIEKKPLRRFHPRSLILSVGSFGCNLRCPFCQNHEISMSGPQSAVISITPDKLTEKAVELKERGNIGLAYTYNEPLVGFEFVLDCAALIHENGLYNVLVTNGTADEQVWRRLLPYIDAANIDLKGFTKEWYRRLGGDLDAVKRSITFAAERCHIEVTTLIVPGENDSVSEIRDLSRWLASVSPEIPLHISRFFPRYRMSDRSPTPTDTVCALANEARAYLKYVYTGNM